MFVHQKARSVIGRMIFTLLCITGMILPAQGVSAAPQAGGRCEATRARAAGAPVVRVASADEEVVIPQEEVDTAVKRVYWRVYFKDVFEAEHAMFTIFFNRTTMKPGSDIMGRWADRYEQIITERITPLSGVWSYDEMIHGMLDAALEIPELRAAVPGIWKELTELTPDSIVPGIEDEIASSAQRYNVGEKWIKLAEESLIEIEECAKEDPEVAEDFDEFQSEELENGANISIRDNAKTILQKNPNLPVPPAIRNNIQPDNSLKISLNELKEMSAAEFAKLNGTIDDIQKTVKEIDAKQNSIIDYLSNELEKEAMAEMARQKEAEYRLKLDAISSSLTAISAIVEYVDPEFARDFSVTSSSLLQIGVSINGWLNAVAGRDGIDKVMSLSTVVMTGNVIGAVMNIVSLFGDDEITPDQMILDEIGKLREQVDQLRTEMHDRFDRIDEELNTIYTTMHERFDQIDLALGKINGNIEEVQESLLELDVRLSRIERNNFEFLNALGRRPLLEAINGGLGYEERTNKPMPYEPLFVEFENTFHSWATLHAFDPLNAGPTQRDYSDAQVLSELSAYPLDAQINYLNGWLIAHGMTPIANKQLASPRDWLFASRAYAQLGLEWPEHMAEIDPQRQKTIDAVGRDLEDAMRKISTIQTANGPVGNSLLFSTVITNYQDQMDAFYGALQQIETTFVNEVQTNYLQRAEPFNLYGGTTQPLTYVSPEISKLTCGDAQANGGIRELNSNIKALIPNFELYNLAEYLKLGKFKGCLTDEWKDLQSYTEDDPEFPDRPPTYFYAGEHYAILTIFFEDVPLVRQTIYDGWERMEFYTPDTWTRDSWTGPGGHKEKFDAWTTADQLPQEIVAQQQALFNTVTGKVQAELAKFQQGLYARVLNEMKQGPLKPLAVEIAGGKALLDAFVALGLPRAVSNNEFLHAMLYGSQRLVDDTLIARSYAISATQPITMMNILVNPLWVVEETAEKRSDALEKLINDYLEDITAKSYVEKADFIANTRYGLEMTMRLAEVDLPDNPDNPGDPNNPGDPGDPSTPTDADRLLLPLIGT